MAPAARPAFSFVLSEKAKLIQYRARQWQVASASTNGSARESFACDEYATAQKPLRHAGK
jgi:hypothetical protein